MAEEKKKALPPKKCPVCGKEFTPRHKRQKYCSPSCCRYANRHGGKTFDGTVIISNPNKPAIRVFLCKHCGEEVRVTEELDMRTKFCSQRCENLYWKHSKKHKKGKGERRTFTCRNCGKKVVITDSHDRRSIFCCSRCCAAWHGRRRRDREGEKP